MGELSRSLERAEKEKIGEVERLNDFRLEKVSFLEQQLKNKELELAAVGVKLEEKGSELTNTVEKWNETYMSLEQKNTELSRSLERAEKEKLEEVERLEGLRLKEVFTLEQQP